MPRLQDCVHTLQDHESPLLFSLFLQNMVHDLWDRKENMQWIRDLGVLPLRSRSEASAYIKTTWTTLFRRARFSPRPAERHERYNISVMMHNRQEYTNEYDFERFTDTWSYIHGVDHVKVDRACAALGAQCTPSYTSMHRKGTYGICINSMQGSVTSIRQIPLFTSAARARAGLETPSVRNLLDTGFFMWRTFGVVCDSRNRTSLEREFPELVLDVTPRTGREQWVTKTYRMQTVGYECLAWDYHVQINGDMQRTDENVLVSNIRVLGTVVWDGRLPARRVWSHFVRDLPVLRGGLRASRVLPDNPASRLWMILLVKMFGDLGMGMDMRKVNENMIPTGVFSFMLCIDDVMAEIYAILCKGYVLCSSAEFYNQGLLLHARLLDADLVTQMIDRFQIAVERSDLRLTSEHVVRMVSTIAMHLHRGLAYNACREILTDILHDRRPVDTFLPESRLDANRRGYMYCTRDRCFAKK